MKKRFVYAAVAAAVLMTGGCGEATQTAETAQTTESTQAPEIETTTESETATEIETTTESETATETETVTESETAIETESVKETETVTESETATETATETEAKGKTAVTEKESETTTEAATEKESETTTEAATEKESETTTEAATEKERETTTEAVTEKESETTTEAVSEAESEPATEAADTRLRVMIGSVEDISMDKVKLLTDNGNEISISTETAEIDLPGGIRIGDLLSVSYTGRITKKNAKKAEIVGISGSSDGSKAKIKVDAGTEVKTLEGTITSLSMSEIKLTAEDKKEYKFSIVNVPLYFAEGLSKTTKITVSYTGELQDTDGTVDGVSVLKVVDTEDTDKVLPIEIQAETEAATEKATEEATEAATEAATESETAKETETETQS